MTQAEAYAPVPLSTQEVLEQRRNLACLQFVVVLDLVKPDPAENLVIPNVHYLHKMHIADHELMFASHSLSQYMHPDTPTDDEVAWTSVVQEGMGIVSREVKQAKRFRQAQLWREGFLAENRLDFHRMLYSIRTRGGDRVISPYGLSFAEQVAEGEVNIPETVAVTVEDVKKISGDSVLKYQLLERLAQLV